MNLVERILNGLGQNPIMPKPRLWTPNKLNVTGLFTVEHRRSGKIIDRFSFHNGVTNEGKNKMLDVMFHGVSAISTWYLGLINNSGFSALAAGDTMSSHAGWTELDTASNTIYDETTRPEWAEGAASGQAITNPSATVFTFNNNAAVYGIFVASNSTKGGSTGTLWSTGAFNAVRNVVDNDTLNITYQVSL